MRLIDTNIMKPLTSTVIPQLALPLKSICYASMLLCLSATAQAQPKNNKPEIQRKANENTADLNFVNADIEAVIKAVGHFTGNTFIIDPRVKGQLTLVSEKALTKDQAFKLLTSTLRLQGFAVVTADGYSKVVPESDAKLQAGPAQSGSAERFERSEASKGDQVVTQVYKLNFESPNNIVTVLRPLISPNNTINANPGNNTVVITDYADNIKRLNKIIAALDMPASTDMDVIPVKHAIASDVAAMVSRMLDSGAADPNKVNLLADPRTNSVLLRAPTLARANLVKSLIAKLDTPTALPGNIHVVYLKNAEAVKLAATLRAILSGDGSNLNQSSSQGSTPSSQVGGNTPTSASGSTTTINSAISSNVSALSPSGSATTGSSSGSAGGAAGFIQADPATNTLIITASEAVYRNLRSVIDQLDARRAQVYVEALIVEMSVDKANEFGIQWMGLSGDKNSAYRVGGTTSFSKDGNNLLSLAGGNYAKSGSVLPGKGLSIGIFRQLNGQLGLGALAHALESEGGSNVLSIPTVITLDNEEASIGVGKNVPIITGQFTNGTSTGTAGANPFQTIDRKEVGIKLTVRPQISEGGTVKMAIAQTVSSVDDTTNTAGIITKERNIKTNVLVDDGQILVLGGLMQDDTNDSVEKVPLLGDVPFFGNFFKYQSTKRGKSTLMVFLRPLIMKTANQSESLSLDRYDFMRTQTLNVDSSIGSGQLPEVEKGKLLNLPSNPGDKKSQPAKKEGK